MWECTLVLRPRGNHDCFCFFFSLIVHVIIELYFSVSAFAVLQEDPVLLAPETKEQKPDIVIIKVIAWNCFVLCHRLLIDPFFFVR